MANAFTNLIPSIYEALDVVSRELVGFIPAVNKDTAIDRAALGETVYFHVAAPIAATDIAPAKYIPDPSDLNEGSDSMQLTKARSASFYVTGEEAKGLDNGAKWSSVFKGKIQQAFRTLTNEMEQALAGLLIYASRAYAVTSGNIFDATDSIGSIAQVRRILSDNGANLSDLHLVLDTNFAAKLRSMAVLYKANEAGTDQMLRDGILGRLHGMAVHESGGIAPVTIYSGTPSGLVIDGTGNIAKGSTSLKLKTGSGAFRKGDVVTIGADTSQRYVVAADGTATALSINGPGIVAAVADGNAVAKIGALTAYTPLAAFGRNALTLATRVPALPPDGDAGEHIVAQDPVSGIAFDIARYRQYRREVFEVSIVYGVKCTKSEHLALIMGS